MSEEFLLGLVIGIAIGILWLIANHFTALHDARTRQICRKWDRINKREWADTEFAGFNWYQSCLNNNYYTSPLHYEK
jgi:hypothetical protein